MSKLKFLIPSVLLAIFFSPILLAGALQDSTSTQADISDSGSSMGSGEGLQYADELPEIVKGQKTTTVPPRNVSSPYRSCTGLAAGGAYMGGTGANTRCTTSNRPGAKAGWRAVFNQNGTVTVTLLNSIRAYNQHYGHTAIRSAGNYTLTRVNTGLGLSAKWCTGNGPSRGHAKTGRLCVIAGFSDVKLLISEGSQSIQQIHNGSWRESEGADPAYWTK